MKLIRARCLCFAVTLWSGRALFAAESVPTAGPRVFVCAHSFMIYTAKLLPPMAEAAGIAHVNAGQQMIGGSRVIQLWNLPNARNLAKSALREGKVDGLTLSPSIQMPDPGIDRFTKLGLEKNSALRGLVQASWPPYDGTGSKSFRNPTHNAAPVPGLRAQRDAQRTTFLASLETQVRSLNPASGHQAVFLVPMSDAVFALRERIAEGRAPGLTKPTDLFRDDLGHP